MIAAVSIAAASAVLIFAARARGSAGAVLLAVVPIAGVCVLLWGLSFEVDRIVERLAPETLRTLAVLPGELRALGWALLWGAGGVATASVGRARRTASLTVGGWWILAASSLSWLAVVLGSHVWEQPGGLVVLNVESAVGVLLLAGHAIAASRPGEPDAATRRAASIALALLLGLWLGSIEIDRAMRDQMAVQAGLSVWWGLFGVGLVIGGFARRAAVARWAGLALLAVTVGKVVLVDLATVEKLWRVISFIVSGLLLVGTSVLYAKLSPRLLGAQAASPGEAGDAPGSG
jgi:hypothetical protein